MPGVPAAVHKSGQPGQNYGRDDGELAALVAGQHGVVSRAQLQALGYGPYAIRYRLRMGRLHRVHEGVFAVGHARVTTLGHYMAAVLTCGPAALASHQAAGSLWDFLPSARQLMDVTVPGRGPGPRPGIAVHARQVLHPDDRAERNGVPVTSVARTLRDLAAVLPRRRLERAFEEAERLRLLDLRALGAVGERRRGHVGCGAFATLLDERHDPKWTRSELERRFLGLCAEAGLPPPVVNGAVLGFEADFHWPGRSLIVEVDGYAYHRTRASFERDRARDAALHTAGYVVLRLTERRLQSDPGAAIGQVLALLA